MPLLSASVQWAINTCRRSDVGYSQDYRNQQTVNGITYYDCSSFINYAIIAGGWVTPAYAPNNNPFTTDNERSVLLSLGWKKGDFSKNWKAGAIVWRKGHTEMVYSSTMCMGARGREHYKLEDQVAIHTSSPSDWAEIYYYPSSNTSTWHVKEKGGYSNDSAEALDNATNIYDILSGYGWTLNAVAGLLGNVCVESGLNPWRWQNNNVGASTGSPWTNSGYGLVQFTPASKYIDDSRAQSFDGYGPNFSDKQGNANDGSAQLEFVDKYADYSKTDAYPLTYAQYKTSTADAEYLAVAWLYNYERPRDPSASIASRKANAKYWYEALSGVTPTPPSGGDNSLFAFLLCLLYCTN